MSKFDIIARQSNAFIESAFVQEYTEQELKTMEFIISQTIKTDLLLAETGEIKHIELSVYDFAKMINAHPDQIYRDAKTLSNGLMNKRIMLNYLDDRGRKAFTVHTFLTSMEYANGVVKIGINPYVLPYFLNVIERFTNFNLRFIIAMGSSYGIKLYKLLKQYQLIGNRTITLNELRTQFGINDSKYPRYNDFKRFVIETAIRHICLHTDLQIDYVAEKLGRKVDKLNFFIKSKMPQSKQAELAFIEWANKCNDNHLKMLLSDAEKKKQNPMKYTKVAEVYEWFLINKVKNYDANSCDALQFFENVLFNS